MVIVPQTKNKTMITADTFATIEKSVKAVFPELKKVNNSFSDEGIKLAFTLPELRTGQLMNLMSLVVQKHHLDVSIKRSGTGISIHLN